MSDLYDLLVSEAGLIASALGDRPADDGESIAYAAVREGQRLHAGDPRVVTRADPDLALLAGDRLYALGLDRLAEAGDLPAIAALAELISACAQAQADGDPQAAQTAWERLARPHR